MVPGPIQSAAEMAVTKLQDYFTGTMGRDNARRYFPVMATFFIFIVVSNYSGILPGAGHGFAVPTANLSTTAGLAIIAFFIYGSADKNLIAVVDYAHNKLSFEKLFSSIKDEYPDYNIVSIFGCPGKKAFIRRRDLGTVAGQYAKKVYLTAEDPGYEPVEQISKEIAQYVEAQNCPYAMIEDRGEAIKAAMDEAEGKTIFLITGKGNETRQKYGCEYLDCKSDTQYVKEYLAEYDKKHQ